MKFLVDNQLPLALSHSLASQGYDSLHVMQANLSGSSDIEIWRYACETGRVIVSKDEDFLFLCGRKCAGTGFIWVR